jgi:hypothetical protein
MGRDLNKRGARQILLALFKGPVELRGPNDGMRTIASGTGDSVMKRYLNSSSVGQRSAVSVQQA